MGMLRHSITMQIIKDECEIVYTNGKDYLKNILIPRHMLSFKVGSLVTKRGSGTEFPQGVRRAEPLQTVKKFLIL